MVLEALPGVETIAGTSLIIVVIIYIIMTLLYFYTLYLNWRQAKVADQMKELVTVTTEIRNILKEKK